MYVLSVIKLHNKSSHVLLEFSWIVKANDIKFETFPPLTGSVCLCCVVEISIFGFI